MKFAITIEFEKCPFCLGVVTADDINQAATKLGVVLRNCSFGEYSFEVDGQSCLFSESKEPRYEMREITLNELRIALDEFSLDVEKFFAEERRRQFSL